MKLYKASTLQQETEMKVQIHCDGADGNKYIMNRLNNYNMDAAHNPQKYAQLLVMAAHMAYTWGKVYPHDKFKVVEV